MVQCARAGWMLVAFDDLSFCSACVWLNCPLFCLSPHRIAKVDKEYRACGSLTARVVVWFASLENAVPLASRSSADRP